MSRGELVEAFLDGRMSRRTLIRRLVAAGVSVGAAVSYAELLKPERAAAQVAEDLYPLITLTILSSDLDSVENNDQVRVRVTSTEELRTAIFRPFRLIGGSGLQSLGVRKEFVPFMNAAGTRDATIPVEGSKLTGLQSARIVVQLIATDADAGLTTSSAHQSVATVTKQISR